MIGQCLSNKNEIATVSFFTWQCIYLAFASTRNALNLMVPLPCDKFQSGGVGEYLPNFFLNLLLLPDFFDLTSFMDVELFATLSKLADDLHYATVYINCTYL